MIIVRNLIESGSGFFFLFIPLTFFMNDSSVRNLTYFGNLKPNLRTYMIKIYILNALPTFAECGKPKSGLHFNCNQYYYNLTHIASYGCDIMKVI